MTRYAASPDPGNGEQCQQWLGGALHTIFQMIVFITGVRAMTNILIHYHMLLSSCIHLDGSSDMGYLKRASVVLYLLLG